MSVIEIEQKLFGGATSFTTEEVVFLLNVIRILRGLEGKE
ncbi:hypothetical protein QFZ31_006685 [Neobacillus niacini]|nr:hypothetical protein [Neobacillus niacini]